MTDLQGKGLPPATYDSISQNFRPTVKGAKGVGLRDLDEYHITSFQRVAPIPLHSLLCLCRVRLAVQ